MKKSRFSGFSQFARKAAEITGRPITFAIACISLLLWLVSGPLFHFNDTWQLVINTVTTIITFLMVFLIQSSQNLDTEALHMKLDELIRATQGADDDLMNLEQLDREELHRIHERHQRIVHKAGEMLGRPKDD